MIELYLFGSFFALCIGLIKCFISFSTSTSIQFRNLNQVDIYYDLVTGSATPVKPAPFILYFYLGDVLLLGTLLSWFTVGSFFSSLFKIYINKPPVPERIKELQFKISSTLLPKKIVEEIVKETGEFYGFKSEEINDKNKHIIEKPFLIDFNNTEVIAQESNPIEENIMDSNTLVIDSGEHWYSEVEIKTSERIYQRHSHSGDYLSNFRSKSEYKIEGKKVFVRLLEDWFEHVGYQGASGYNVKDNVVLESDINRRGSEDQFFKVEEKILELKKEVEWNETENYQIKYFILYKHPEILSLFEFKKFLRLEKERLIKICNAMKDFAPNNDLVVNEGDAGLLLRFKDGLDETATENTRVKFNKFLNENNCFSSEIENYKKIIQSASKYLGE